MGGNLARRLKECGYPIAAVCRASTFICLSLMKIIAPVPFPIGILFSIALAFTVAHLQADESFSPAPAPRPVVLLDYYHRMPKQTKIGQHLLTGSYSDTVGRYRTDDFSHTNSYDSFLNALEQDFDLRVHETPLTKGNLTGADIVMLRLAQG